MQNEIQTFKFKENNIRITDIEGNLWWVAKDIADTIEHKDNYSMLRLINPKYVKTITGNFDSANLAVSKSNSKGGSRRLKVVSEPGVWQILARTSIKNEVVEKFQDWFYEDVLPQIRKTGRYSVQKKYDDPILNMAEGIIQIRHEQLKQKEYIEEHEKRILNIENKLENKVEDNEKLLDAPMKTLRARLNQIVRDYVSRADYNTKEEFQECMKSGWNMLYNEMYYRLSVNVYKRAGKLKIKPIEYIEQEGMLPTAISIANRIFNNEL